MSSHTNDYNSSSCSSYNDLTINVKRRKASDTLNDLLNNANEHNQELLQVIASMFELVPTCSTCDISHPDDEHDHTITYVLNLMITLGTKT